MIPSAFADTVSTEIDGTNYDIVYTGNNVVLKSDIDAFAKENCPFVVAVLCSVFNTNGEFAFKIFLLICIGKEHL